MAKRTLTNEISNYFAALVAEGKMDLNTIREMSITDMERAYRRAHPVPVEMEPGFFVVLGYTKGGLPTILRREAFEAPKGAGARRGSAGRPEEGWTIANDAHNAAWEAFKDANPPGSHCVRIFSADAVVSEED